MIVKRFIKRGAFKYLKIISRLQENAMSIKKTNRLMTFMGTMPVREPGESHRFCGRIIMLMYVQASGERSPLPYKELKLPKLLLGPTLFSPKM
jgi:hypothetical protein